MLYPWRRALEDGAVNLWCRMRQHAMVGKVALPLDMRISAGLRKAIVLGEYEKNELDIVRRTLGLDDRILECGAGIGLLSTYCSLEIGSDRVKTFEANPFMGPLISKTFSLNRVSPTLVMGAIGPRQGQLEFHVRENFWASSSHHARAEGSVQTITVPVYALHDEILVTRPTYLLVDIEGAEVSLVGSSELPGVKKVMVEVHPELTGESGVRDFLSWLSDLGFRKDDGISRNREIYLERR